MLKLLIQKINQWARMPEYAHLGDAGMDLFSVDEAILEPFERKLIHTGIKIQLPPHTEAQIRPRSGLALKNGITILNTPGTIDEAYRGEIGIILINLSREAFEVKKGMKIAQMVIKSSVQVEINEVTVLEESSRGEDGFGSTGI